MRLETNDEREVRESGIYHHMLMKQPDPYKEVSNELNIKICGEKYSIHWILLYSRARESGIACMYTSCLYSNRKMDGVEWHDWDKIDRRVDVKLLWRAHLHLLKQKSPPPAKKLAEASV